VVEQEVEPVRVELEVGHERDNGMIEGGADGNIHDLPRLPPSIAELQWPHGEWLGSETSWEKTDENSRGEGGKAPAHDDLP
jgi:hypothetical protein